MSRFVLFVRSSCCLFVSLLTLFLPTFHFFVLLADSHKHDDGCKYDRQMDGQPTTCYHQSIKQTHPPNHLIYLSINFNREQGLFYFDLFSLSCRNQASKYGETSAFPRLLVHRIVPAQLLPSLNTRGGGGCVRGSGFEGLGDVQRFLIVARFILLCIL